MNKSNWGGIRTGAGRTPLSKDKKKKPVKIYISDLLKQDIEKYGLGDSFSRKAVDLIASEIKKRRL
ncbi:hypothetical protein [Vallitalea guaymasensis]|uniref:hypothetical protein n=1 Tax=Vallitalea guaymasensis TaxID=1185412 RepID=UPI002356C8B6|nr:hypothetical protein [Vallitalea guaymasensis]